LAAPARKTIHCQLSSILPGSSSLMNYLRTFRTFYNFAWTLTDAATFKLLKAPFTYELAGENFLNGLAATERAIILTAHMGNYDLGAGLFTEKFTREIRMVRAPEPDELTAQHVDCSLEQSSRGAVKVDYSTEGTSLSFDLLAALRAGQIISIQGDRVVGNVARSAARFFSKQVFMPTGPFVSFARRGDADLSLVHRARRISKIQNHRARADYLPERRSSAGIGNQLRVRAVVAVAGGKHYALLASTVRLHADL
jgi:lauroyl/myristoyl acyltransferase